MSEEPNKNYLSKMLIDVVKTLKPLESDWHRLGIHLKIEKHKLDTIEKDYFKAERRFTEVVSYWINNEKEPSWKKLADAVHAVEGYEYVVRDIHLKFLTSPSSDNDMPSESGYGSSSGSVSDAESDIFDTTSLSPGCGCGECDIHKMCTEGCPQPDYTKRLPILTKFIGGETASESATKRIVPQSSHSADIFEQETESICEHFGDMVTDTCKSLKKETVKAVALHLLNSFPILKKMREMSSAENMEALFLSFTDQACSWFNFRIIENLIKKFGDKEDKKRLAMYQKHFESFAKQRLPQGKKHVELGSKSGLIGCKKLVVKVDRHWDSITITELDRLCGEFARILGIERKNLYLADVNEGCIMLTLMIPQGTAKTLSESQLTNAQKKMLANESVVRLNCGGLRWTKSLLFQLQNNYDSDNEGQVEPRKDVRSKVREKQREAEPGLHMLLNPLPTPTNNVLHEDTTHSSESFNSNKSELCVVFGTKTHEGRVFTASHVQSQIGETACETRKHGHADLNKLPKSRESSLITVENGVPIITGGIVVLTMLCIALATVCCTNVRHIRPSLNTLNSQEQATNHCALELNTTHPCIPYATTFDPDTLNSTQRIEHHCYSPNPSPTLDSNIPNLNHDATDCYSEDQSSEGSLDSSRNICRVDSVKYPLQESYGEMTSSIATGPNVDVHPRSSKSYMLSHSRSKQKSRPFCHSRSQSLSDLNLNPNDFSPAHSMSSMVGQSPAGSGTPAPGHQPTTNDNRFHHSSDRELDTTS